ncbi:MAG: hypothetical protein IJ545_04640 [Alphaproteobacteria bacterium]|nr:hypothetical protein [Alphaproteobacteria bacterium]
MTKAKILDIILRFVAVALAIAAFLVWYNFQIEKRVKAECSLSQAQEKIEQTQAQQKEVEHVAHQKAVIYSKPNASRDSLLDEMRAGKL